MEGSLVGLINNLVWCSGLFSARHIDVINEMSHEGWQQLDLNQSPLFSLWPWKSQNENSTVHVHMVGKTSFVVTCEFRHISCKQ